MEMDSRIMIIGIFLSLSLSGESDVTHEDERGEREIFSAKIIASQ